MKNRKIRQVSILFFLFLLVVATGVQAGQLDIAPLFAGYEEGCGIHGTAAERLIVWANPDDKGRLAPNKHLSLPWRNHVGTPSVTDQVDHWFVRVPLRGVRFHGLRLLRLERWYGKSNGISGWALVFAETLIEVQPHIDEKRFRFDADGNFKPELSSDQNGQGAKLVCDVSM